MFSAPLLRDRINEDRIACLRLSNVDVSHRNRVGSNLLCFPSPVIQVINGRCLRDVLHRSLRHLLRIATVNGQELTNVLCASSFCQDRAIQCHGVLIRRLVPSRLVLRLRRRSTILSRNARAIINVVFTMVIIAPGQRSAVEDVRLLRVFRVEFRLVNDVIRRITNGRRRLRPLNVNSFRRLSRRINALQGDARVRVHRVRGLVTVRMKERVNEEVDRVFRLRSLPSLCRSVRRPSRRHRNERSNRRPERRRFRRSRCRLQRRERGSRERGRSRQYTVGLTRLRSRLDRSSRREKGPPRSN